MGHFCEVFILDAINKFLSDYGSRYLCIVHVREKNLGTHSIELMVDIVAELTKAGMSDEWIKKNIGMDADELLRLKQISGLMELFADREFTIPEP